MLIVQLRSAAQNLLPSVLKPCAGRSSASSISAVELRRFWNTLSTTSLELLVRYLKIQRTDRKAGAIFIPPSTYEIEYISNEVVLIYLISTPSI